MCGQLRIHSYFQLPLFARRDWGNASYSGGSDGISGSRDMFPFVDDQGVRRGERNWTKQDGNLIHYHDDLIVWDIQ